MKHLLMIVACLAAFAACSVQSKVVRSEDLLFGSTKMYYTLDKRYCQHQVDSMIRADRLAKLQKWIKSPLVDDSGTPLTQYIFIRSIDRGSELIYTVTQERQDTVYKCTKRVTEKVDYR